MTPSPNAYTGPRGGLLDPDMVKQQVIARGCSVIERPIADLSSDTAHLHNMGYHAYSTAMANFRYALEQAREKFLEEMGVE